MKKQMIGIGFLVITCLTACQGGNATVAETNWTAAKKAETLEMYIKEQGEKLDVEALKAEAGSAESSLSQQFKAAALLSGMEYWDHMEANETSDSASAKAMAFRSDYPVSGPYVEQYLKNVTTGGEEFWKSLDDAFYPYDCFLPMFAAAEDIDGMTLTTLIEHVPDDAGYASKLEDAVNAWIKNKPEKIVDLGSDFINSAFFDEWDLEDWKGTYLYNYSNPDSVKTDGAGEALEYVGYLRQSMLPMLKAEYGIDKLLKESEIGEEEYYSTKLMVTVNEPLDLKEPEEGSLPETIETEGKKIAAFYRNPYTKEWAGSPASLRLMGDFMLQLPEEVFPASIEEADYYLVLTPEYEYGDFYQDQSGKDTKIQQINSSTSIDLYEAETGAFLRHLGAVPEEPAQNLFRDLSAEALEYPESISADRLTYIYNNINEPDLYISLTDQITGMEADPQKGEAVVFGSWKITFHSGKIVKSFDEGIYRYTATDGNQFVRGEFTITNVGIQKENFLPRVYYLGKDPVVRIADSKRENFYDSVDAMTSGSCLNGTSLEKGESKDGMLLFEVPDEVIQREEPLYVEISLGKRSVYYLLEE